MPHHHGAQHALPSVPVSRDLPLRWTGRVHPTLPLPGKQHALGSLGRHQGVMERTAPRLHFIIDILIISIYPHFSKEMSLFQSPSALEPGGGGDDEWPRIPRNQGSFLALTLVGLQPGCLHTCHHSQ